MNFLKSNKSTTMNAVTRDMLFAGMFRAIWTYDCQLKELNPDQMDYELRQQQVVYRLMEHAQLEQMEVILYPEEEYVPLIDLSNYTVTLTNMALDLLQGFKKLKADSKWMEQVNKEELITDLKHLVYFVPKMNDAEYTARATEFELFPRLLNLVDEQTVTGAMAMDILTLQERVHIKRDLTFLEMHACYMKWLYEESMALGEVRQGMTRKQLEEKLKAKHAECEALKENNQNLEAVLQRMVEEFTLIADRQRTKADQTEDYGQRMEYLALADSIDSILIGADEELKPGEIDFVWEDDGMTQEALDQEMLNPKEVVWKAMNFVDLLDRALSAEDRGEFFEVTNILSLNQEFSVYVDALVADLQRSLDGRWNISMDSVEFVDAMDLLRKDLGTWCRMSEALQVDIDELQIGWTALSLFKNNAEARHRRIYN